MNELKEQIMLNASCSMASYEIGSGKKMGVRIEMDLDTLMQLIETYTAKKELESYKQGIIAGWEESAEGYNCEYSGFPAVSTEEIVTQLSSQLKESL